MLYNYERGRFLENRRESDKVRTYGREVGYYVCGRQHCRCNVSTKKTNAAFEQVLSGTALPGAFVDALRAQLKKAFPILNQEGAEEITVLKTNLAHKETEISQIEYNLAIAPDAKVQEIHMQHLEKLESEKEVIQRELADSKPSSQALSPKPRSSRRNRGGVKKHEEIEQIRLAAKGLHRAASLL